MLPSAPITKLTCEVLLQIFESFAPHQSAHHKADLCSFARCCKAWYPLAQAVLYRDVVLLDRQFPKFAQCPRAGNAEIRSLTLRLESVPRNPFKPEYAMQVERDRLRILYAMVQWIVEMESLACFSIHAEIRSAHDRLVSPVLRATSLIIDALPASCVSLEIDILADVTYTKTTGPTHICPSVRRVMPRLEHLRLRVPWMCQELVATPGGTDEDSGCGFVDAPRLRDFTINASLRHPGVHSKGYHTSTCWTPGRPNAVVGTLTPGQDDLASAIHAEAPMGVAPALKGFCARNPKLERLWVIDNQHRPRHPPNTWAAWIRRDFTTKTSLPIPVTGASVIGSGLTIINNHSCMLRLPCRDGAAGTEDLVAEWSLAEELVEGSAWTTTLGGVRLPRQRMRTRGYEPDAPVVSGSAARQEARDVTAVQLWQHEAATGQTILPKGPGALLQRWDMTEKTPSGWVRENQWHTPMVRLAD